MNVGDGRGGPDGERLRARWTGLFDGVPGYSVEVFAAFDEHGRLADRERFDEVVNEVGWNGKTAGMLMSWASVLACTHAPGDDVLGPFIPVIGDTQWQAPVHRHGRALINTARIAPGNPDGVKLLLDQSVRISEALGNDIWWLTLVMAYATFPVQRDLGGWARFDEINDLVTESLLELGAARAGATVAAGLAAINAGQLDRARACLGLLDVPGLLTVLVPLARRLLRGTTSMDVVVQLDPDGTPVSVGAAQTPAITLTRDLLNAVLALDPARLARTRAAISAASHDDQVLMTWYLALTLGHHLPMSPG